MLVGYKVLNIINALADTLGSIRTPLCLLLSCTMMPGEKVFHRVKKRASKGLGCVRHREYLFFHRCGSRSAPGPCSLARFGGFRSRNTDGWWESSPDGGVLYLHTLHVWKSSWRRSLPAPCPQGVLATVRRVVLGSPQPPPPQPPNRSVSHQQTRHGQIGWRDGTADFNYFIYK